MTRSSALRRVASAALAVTVLAAASAPNLGCFRQRVEVGAGGPGQAAERTEMNQWFAFWGLLPITKIDPEAAIGDAENYTVESVFTPIDVLFNVFTGFATIYRKTIAVEK